MDYFDRESRGSGHSKSVGGNILNKNGRASKQGSEYSRLNEEGKEAYLNQNSSTAMGTNMHGQSLQIDIDGNLQHNQSIEMAQNSPGMKSKRSGVRDVIAEEEGDDQADGDQSRLSKKTKNGIISGAGLRSNQTLGQVDNEYGSEATSQVPSPSLKSLMKAKHGGLDPNAINEGLKESIKQNQKKVKGTTSIKNLIRSAATRT